MQYPIKSEIEEAIRLGDQSKASLLLSHLNLKQIKRQDAFDFARFARRIRAFHLALRILNPIVRPKTKNLAPAEPRETIEYAASIRGLGAPTEALDLLQSIDENLNPEVLLECSFNHFAQWDYQKAVPKLKKYVTSTKIEDYARTIGLVNLSSALLGCDEFKEAENILNDLIAETAARGYSQLHFNCQEMLGQVQIRGHKDFEGAIQRLQLAVKKYDADPNDISLLFAKKWMAIGESLLQNTITQSFDRVRAQALAFNHWETLRDLDFYEAQINKDEEKLVSLYVGTPFESYRTRILQVLKISSLPDYFIRGPKNDGFKIDLESGSVTGRTDIFQTGSILHQILILLNQDFYRPLPLLTIFSKLYPDQHFCPQTSANRIQQNICRFRKLIEQHSLPLDLQEYDGNYRLMLSEKICTRIPKNPLPLNKVALLSRKIRKGLEAKTFVTQQACVILQMSKSNVQRLLVEATEHNLVDKIGQGRSSFYQFKKSS